MGYPYLIHPFLDRSFPHQHETNPPFWVPPLIETPRPPRRRPSPRRRPRGASLISMWCLGPGPSWAHLGPCRKLVFDDIFGDLNIQAVLRNRPWARRLLHQQVLFRGLRKTLRLAMMKGSDFLQLPSGKFSMSSWCSTSVQGVVKRLGTSLKVGSWGAEQTVGEHLFNAPWHVDAEPLRAQSELHWMLVQRHPRGSSCWKYRGFPQGAVMWAMHGPCMGCPRWAYLFRWVSNRLPCNYV